MKTCPATILVPVGGAQKVTHYRTRSLLDGRHYNYILVHNPLRANYPGDRLDLAGTYWWDRRPPTTRRIHSTTEALWLKPYMTP